MGRVKRILLLAASLGVAAGAHGQDERAAEEAEGAVAESAGQEPTAQQPGARSARRPVQPASATGRHLIASSAITKTRRIPEACRLRYSPTFKSFSVKSCCLMNSLNHGPSTSLVS